MCPGHCRIVGMEIVVAAEMGPDPETDPEPERRKARGRLRLTIAPPHGRRSSSRRFRPKISCKTFFLWSSRWTPYFTLCLSSLLRQRFNPRSSAKVTFDNPRGHAESLPILSCSMTLPGFGLVTDCSASALSSFSSCNGPFASPFSVAAKVWRASADAPLQGPGLEGRPSKCQSPEGTHRHGKRNQCW